ncbi:cytochrome P450 94B1-like [Cucurbita maxima]|uniref:Cytochrome P450 94B1-like n=1 Tax=Cucurbita maxima TaxID=3661 RepID=A0A6J1HMR4_CUCMA|nr:cytochrome P450 94B1-like [Cucurbita maxima]
MQDLAVSLFLLLSISLWAFFLIYVFIYKFHRFSTNRSSPPSYPFIGCFISFFKNRRRLLSWYTHLLSNSPSLTIVVHRLGSRRTVVTANPANVEYMLKTNFLNYPKGKPFTDILGDLLGCGIFNVDGELWSTQRKLASHEFSAKSLREFVVKTLEDEIHLRLIPLLQNAARTNGVLDLQDVLGRLAFDTVCKMTLGTDEQCLDMSRPVPAIVNAFDMATGISAKRAIAPVSLAWKAKRLFNIGSEKRLKEAVQMVHSWVSHIIRNKNLDNNEDSDLLSRLLSAGHGEEVVRDMVVSFIMAGRDTTSAAMTWLFWLLTKHPKVEQTLMDEVASLSNNYQTASLGYGYEELKDMKYLKACLCESMRLYPPVAWDSKHAAAADILPDGTPVRKGDRVTYFPYGMGRMEELWGPDREEFKPERWFEKGEAKAVSPFKFPVFQGGPRMCLGKEMAFIQMKYVVATVLKRFEFRAVSESEPVFVPLLTAHMAGGLQVYVRERRGQK